jgi:ABC-2 family transporter
MTTTFIHPFTGFIDKIFVITEFELRKLRHDFTELITRALQPALWLLIFGEVFSRCGAMHTGNIPYLDFIAPGILAQSVLFVAIFYGINVIWERDLGIVQKFLASPTPRAALVLGKGFSAGTCTLSQAVIVYGLSLLLGVKLDWRPLSPQRSGHRHPCRDAVLHVFAHHRVHCKDARTLHGSRPGAYHAAVLCQQRDLPHHNYARLAEDRFSSKSADICR